jgi:periplasmic divalent cation tolerance protein
MSHPGAALIWCPFPTQEEARAVARVLVAEQLIACANIVPQLISVFVWQGELCEEEEVGMLCKTNTRRLAPAIARLAELHSYDTPAIFGWNAAEAPPATLSWLASVLD